MFAERSLIFPEVLVYDTSNVSSPVISADKVRVIVDSETEMDVTVGFDAAPEIVKSPAVTELSYTFSDIVRSIVVVDVVEADETVGSSLSTKLKAVLTENSYTLSSDPPNMKNFVPSSLNARLLNVPSKEDNVNDPSAV